MARTLFDRPIFVMRGQFIEEIGSLEDAFDLLESWPADQRGLAYETILKACRDAAADRFPLAAACNNLERFLRKAGMLADIETVPDFGRLTPDRNIGSL